MTHHNSPSSKLTKTLLSIVLGATLITTSPLPATAAQGEPVIFINGQQQSFAQAPVLLENRVYVPVRALLEAFGYQVKWDADSQVVKASKKNIEIRISIQDRYAALYDPVGEHYYRNVPTTIHQGRSMVSVRTISELLGMDIQWDAKKQAVRIDTTKNVLFDAILNEDLFTVRTLLENGENPNSEKSSTSALTYAIKSATPSIVEQLVANGAVAEDDDFEHAVAQHDAELVNVMLIHANQGRDTSQLASHLLSEVSIPYLNAEVVKTLLELGADPNHANGKALRGTVSVRHTEIIKDLLAAGADPNTPASDQDAYPLLFEAANAGSLATVNLLLAHNADPNARTTTGWTPLMVAAEHGNIELIQLLLANGANIQAVNKHGGTALAIAHAHGNADTVQALLDAGATETPPIELPEEALFHDTSIAEEDTYAPRKAAARGESHKVLKLLSEDKTSHRMAVAETALYNAVRYGHVELVNMLLASFPDLSVIGAFYSAAETGNEEIIRALATQFQQKGYEIPDYLMSRLMVPAHGNVAVYQTLLEMGFKPGSADPESSSLLPAAVWGLPEVTRLFVEADANPNLINDVSQETALDTAIRSGHIETLKALLGSEKLTQATKDNALIQAVKRDSLDMVTLLVLAGADVHFQTPTGRSPLQQAKENGSSEMIDFLTSAGAIE